MTRGRVALVGAGVIGAGWAGRFAALGWEVAVHDPGPGTEARVAAAVAAARAGLGALMDGPMPRAGEVRVAGSVAEAVEGADWVQESLPERLEVKRAALAEIQAAAPEAPVGSSTSGFRPSVLQEGARNPATILVAHPFHPVYLLPLVEIVPSAATAPGVVEDAVGLLRGLGMAPLAVRAEIDGHIADRLLEAVWREALWLVRDGVATTGEIDAAIKLGFGLRWAQMGLFEGYRLAGGPGGMGAFLAQFGPALAWPWSRLTEVPELDDALIARIVAETEDATGGRPVGELEAVRDRNLVGLLRALKDRDWGAGAVLNAWEAGRRTAAEAVAEGVPTVLARMEVLPSWIDYNGHMTESRYLFAASETTDALLRLIGADLAYVAGGHSYYTAETHILHRGEARVGDRLEGSVQLLGWDAKRLHVFVRLARDGEVLASVEQVLLHVDMKAGRAVPAPEAILGRVAALAEAQAGLPRPEGAGRFVGAPRR